jgi:hypothetical protein
MYVYSNRSKSKCHMADDVEQRYAMNYNALPGPLLLAIVDRSIFKKAVSLLEGNDSVMI